MSTYEFTFLMDKDKKDLVGKLESYLKAAKAKEVKKEDWGVKSLSYPIQKRDEARYVYFVADVETERMQDLEKRIQLDEDLLRYLIVKV